jgi:hypothetical protein
MLFGYPFAPMTFVLASDDRVWVVEAGDAMLRAYSPTGASLASAKLSGPTRSFDARVLATRRAQALTDARGSLDSARATAMFDRTLLPRTMPWVSAALPGPDGEIWLRRFNPALTAPQEFVVVDREARAIAEAFVPHDVEVQQVGRDFLVGVQTLAEGTLAIVEYGIRR